MALRSNGPSPSLTWRLGPNLLLVALLQRLNHGGISERSGVTEDAALRDVSQQAAHDLAAARLGEFRREENLLGAGQSADLLHDVLLQRLDHLRDGGVPLLQRDERGDRLALDLIRH